MKKRFTMLLLACSLAFSTPVYAAKNPNATNNFDTWETPEQQKTKDDYVLNTKSMKIHKPKCKKVSKIAPDNYGTSSESISTLESEGYTECKICFGK